MSEKGKNPRDRSKGAAARTQREQELRGERSMDVNDEEGLQEEENLREAERKPNRQ